MSRLKKITVFVAEDDHYPRELLARYIGERPELTLEGVADNGHQALREIRSGGYDLLFMDINLPGLSGMEVLERLDHPPHVIFTTAYDTFAIKAFDMGAVDYILKPFDQVRFDKAVDRALNRMGKNPPEAASITDIGLSCKDGDSNYLIPYDDIIYVSSHSKHTVIHTASQDIRINRLLKDLSGKLPGTLFKRIHKQYIINIKFASHYKYYQGGNYVVFMNDPEKTTLPMGRKFHDELRDIFK